MKERGILFSAPMVRALLNGSKTQTRRAVKGWPLDWLASGMFTAEYVAHPENHACPYGVPGDRLWVRETFRGPLDDGTFGYRATHDGPFTWETYTWRPSIFMPRVASRITLDITEVRVERLQDISRGDAMAEGCPFPNIAQGDDPREWYRGLWDSINGAGSWDANPWVWAVSFEPAPPLEHEAGKQP